MGEDELATVETLKKYRDVISSLVAPGRRPSALHQCLRPGAGLRRPAGDRGAAVQ